MKKLLPLLFAVALALGACTSSKDTTGYSSNLWHPAATVPTVPSPGPTPLGPPIHVAPDPVVLDAEKTLITARDTFHLYVHLERDHHATLAGVSPRFYQYAEKLRRDGRKWLMTLDRLKNAYKHNRTDQNKASMLTALATVSQGLAETKGYIETSGLTGP